MAEPHTVPILRPDVDALVDPGWRVILFNDEVTPFDVVILALMRAANLSAEVAEMVAVEAHTTGSAVVRRGLAQEQAGQMCDLLHGYSRIPGLCPGLQCQAERDDALG